MRIIAVWIAAISLLGASSAQATDWSGLYFGGHVSGVWSSVDYDHVETNGVGGTENNREAFNTDPTGVTAGFHSGVRHQFGLFVVGGELTYAPMGLEETASTNLNAIPRLRVSRISDTVTATGIVGVSLGTVLAYAKAGYASADVGFENIRIADGELLGASENREDGFVVGGGLEAMMSKNFSFALEYTYMDLDVGNQQQRLGGGPVAAFNDDVDVSSHAVNLRMSYRMDWHRTHVSVK